MTHGQTSVTEIRVPHPRSCPHSFCLRGDSLNTWRPAAITLNAMNHLEADRSVRPSSRLLTASSFRPLPPDELSAGRLEVESRLRGFHDGVLTSRGELVDVALKAGHCRFCGQAWTEFRSLCFASLRNRFECRLP